MRKLRSASFRKVSFVSYNMKEVAIVLVTFSVPFYAIYTTDIDRGFSPKTTWRRRRGLNLNRRRVGARVRK